MKRFLCVVSEQYRSGIGRQRATEAAEWNKALQLHHMKSQDSQGQRNMLVKRAGKSTEFHETPLLEGLMLVEFRTLFPN